MAIMAADKMFRKASISEFSYLSDISANVSRNIKEIASMDIRMTRTRAMLRDALEKLLDEKSFEDISVSEICELSTVRRATFYRHFKDKNDFYEWFLQTMTDQFLAEAGEADEVGSLEEYTRYMHRKLIEFSLENRGLFRRNIGKTALAGSLDMLMSQAATGIAEKVSAEAERRGVALSHSPEFISMFYAGGMVHTLRWWLTNEMPISADALEEGSTDFLLRFLGFETK